jgi:hypothetical protein
VPDRLVLDAVFAPVGVLEEIITDLLCEEEAAAQVCPGDKVDEPVLWGVLEVVVPRDKGCAEILVVGEEVL